MALDLRGTPTGSGAASGASITGTLPAGVTTNDVVYFWVWGKSASQTFSTPSGYTAVSGSPYGAGGEGKAALFRKVAGASESNPSTTVGDSADRNRWIMIAIQGADTTTPEQDVDFVETTDYASSPAMPTSAAGGNTVWSVVFLACGRTAGENPTWPSGWVEDLEVDAPDFTNRNFLARNTSPGTGSIGGGTITVATEPGQEKVVQVLVKEAGAAAGVAKRSTIINQAVNRAANW